MLRKRPRSSAGPRTATGGAATKLLDHFHGWLRYRAWESWRTVQKKNFKIDGVVSTPRKERAETLEDYVAAAVFAFWESVCEYKHSARNKLLAYAARHVYGAISNISWARKAAGFKDESDLARFIRAHSDAPPAAFKKFLGRYTSLGVYQEVARQGFLVEERDEYSEGSVRDQGSGDSESGGDGCHIEKGGKDMPRETLMLELTKFRQCRCQVGREVVELERQRAAFNGERP